MAAERRKLLSLKTLASVFFLLLFVVLFALFSRSWYQVEMDVDVVEPTALRLSWTTPGSPFVLERSTAVYVTPDKKTYRFLVKPKKKVFHLQFRLSEDVASVGVRSVSVSRIGRASKRLDTAAIAKRMFSVGGDKGRIRKDGFVQFRSNKSWLLVRIDAVHPGDKVAFTNTGILLLSGVLIVGLACVLYLLAPAVPVYWLNYVLIVLACVLLNRWSRDQLPFPVFVTGCAVAFTLLGLRLTLLGKSVRRYLKSETQVRGTLYRAVLPALFLGFVVFTAIRQLPVFSGFDTAQLVATTDFRQTRDRFNAFFEENFSLRNELIGINSEVKFSLLKSSPVQKLMVGRDGFVFEGRGERRVEGKDIRRFNNFADYMGRLPLTDDELKQWATVLEGRRDYLKRQGIAYVFAIAPTKNMIYPEKLPGRFQDSQEGPSRYDQLSAYLKKNTTIPFVDLREALLRAKAKHDYPNLYYRVDFHWNYFGAYFAYREIIDVANKYYPDLKLEPLKLEDFSPDVQSDWLDKSYLHALGLRTYAHHADQFVRMRPLDTQRFPSNGVLPDSGIQDTPIPTENRTHNGKPYDVKVVENEQGERPGIVIFGDSFIYKTILYFSVHAKRTAFKRTVFEFPRLIVEGEKPQLLVQEILNMYILHDPPQS